MAKTDRWNRFPGLDRRAKVFCHGGFFGCLAAGGGAILDRLVVREKRNFSQRPSRTGIRDCGSKLRAVAGVAAQGVTLGVSGGWCVCVICSSMTGAWK